MIKINDYSDEIRAKIEEGITNGLETVGLLGERYAKEKCPVVTGRLVNSITHEVNEDEKAAYIGTNVEYAPYVELGTSRTTAKPYLKPAATEHGSEYKRALEQSIAEALND